jgi:hypothetical protein
VRLALPKLECFCLIHHLGDNGGQRLLVDLEDFLSSGEDDRELRSISITLRNANQAALTSMNGTLKAINKHRKSLKYIEIDVGGFMEGGFPKMYHCNAPALHRLLQGCESLSALAVALPPFSWNWRKEQWSLRNPFFFAAMVSAAPALEMSNS